MSAFGKKIVDRANTVVKAVHGGIARSDGRSLVLQAAGAAAVVGSLWALAGFVHGKYHNHQRRKRRMTLCDGMPPAPGLKADGTLILEVERLRKTFLTGKTRSYEWRREQLENLQELLENHKMELIAAMQADFGKPYLEALCTDITGSWCEIHKTLINLKKWMSSDCIYTPIAIMPAMSYIYHDPLGVVCIIGPWNYPLYLLLPPLAGAIAGGNCAVVKFSRYTPRTGALMMKLLPKYLDPDCFAFDYEGGREVIGALLAQRFDYFFFTGSPNVGKIVYENAAKHMVGVTLELGGKNPVFVDRTCDLKHAARRIMFGKTWNAGQTCIAPDYCLVDASVEKQFLQYCQYYLKSMFPDVRKSPDLARIVNKQQTERLAAYMKDGEIFCGGQVDIEGRFIEPTLLRNVSVDTSIMREEIFGPILPIITYTDIDDAINLVRARPVPLALYVFTRDIETEKKVLQLPSGNAMVNDTITFIINTAVPFGGLGLSGVGKYHGKDTFDTFTHKRTVCKAIPWRWYDIMLPLRYAPYSGFSAKTSEQSIALLCLFSVVGPLCSLLLLPSKKT